LGDNLGNKRIFAMPSLTAFFISTPAGKLFLRLLLGLQIDARLL